VALVQGPAGFGLKCTINIAIRLAAHVFSRPLDRRRFKSAASPPRESASQAGPIAAAVADAVDGSQPSADFGPTFAVAAPDHAQKAAGEYRQAIMARATSRSNQASVKVSNSYPELSAFLSPLSGCVAEGTRRAASFVPATDASNELRSMVAATPTLIFRPLVRTDIRPSTTQPTHNGKKTRPQFYV
jgi:hypothetical protein